MMDDADDADGINGVDLAGFFCVNGGPDFRPAVLANRAFRLAAAQKPVEVSIALERKDG